MIRLKHIKTSDLSDATSNYDVDFDEEITLEQLEEYVLSREDLHGDIRIGGIFGERYIDFFRGKVVKDSREPYTGKEVIKLLKANGGWGSMTYFVELREKAI